MSEDRYLWHRRDDLLARLKTVDRGDGQWICKGLPTCNGHLYCREDGSATPRIVKELPEITTENGEAGRLYCFCHNCDQQRRRHNKRPRWTENAA